jgi:branched-chain amino acid transport system permease protein
VGIIGYSEVRNGDRIYSEREPMMKSIRSIIKRSEFVFFLVSLLLLLLPLVVGEGNLFVLSQVLIMGLFATGFNLILGQTGLISFGHAAFFGLGGYIFALLLLKCHVGTLPALLMAPLGSTLAAVIIGWFALRMTGLFFAMITLAFSQLIWAAFYKVYALGGADGLPNLPVASIFLSNRNSYYLVVVISIISFAILRKIWKSPFALTLNAIRDNPIRVEFIGTEYKRYQLGAFILSAFFAGLAGGLNSLLTRYAYPDMLYWATSGDVVIVCVLGGMRYFLGPVVGALAFVGLDRVVTKFTSYWPLALGSILIFIVLFARAGIVGAINQKWRKG